MAKIMTNYLAQKVAKTLVSSTLGVELQKIEDEISEYISPFILAQIPAGVLTEYKINPKYFIVSTNARLTSADITDPVYCNCVYCNCESHPAKTSYIPTYEVPTEVLKKVQALNRKKEALIKKSEEAEYQIKNTLLQLSTFKRIKENFLRHLH